MKWLLRIVVVLAIAAGVGWYYRTALMLEMIGVAVNLRRPVGPHQEVKWSAGPARPAALPTERPPNVVLIVADDLGWNDLTFQGGGVAGGTVPTPQIDSLAAEGVVFSNGYSANGTCAPSRAALMTGRYPTRFGFEFTPTPPLMLPLVARLSEENAERFGATRLPITYFDDPDRQAVPFEEMGVPAGEITLAETLKAAGYHTVHIGKWHLGRSNGMAPHEQGFDESLLMASGLYLPEDDPGVVNSKQDFDPIDRFLWKGMQYAASFNGSDFFEPGGYLTDWWTDEAVKVIDANANRPFFLYLAHWAPHTPLQATQADYDALAHIEDHTLRVYAAMIRALDRGVGRVLEALKRNGLEENTLVIFTSDNGGAHYIGLPEINRPYRGWKISFFEGGIHVPFFMRWPERIASRRRFTTSTSTRRRRRRRKRRRPRIARWTASTCCRSCAARPAACRTSASSGARATIRWRSQTVGSCSAPRDPMRPGSSTCATIRPSSATSSTSTPRRSSTSSPCWMPTMRSRWIPPGPR
jgi:uncharacterized sulfatase